METLTKKVIPIFVIVSILMTIVFLLGQIRQHRQIVDADSARKSGKPIPVSVYNVDIAPIRPLLVGSCSTLPSQVVELSSAIPDAIVNDLFVNMGDIVETGAPLIRLDQREHLARVSRAKDQLKWLKEEVAEKENLVAYYLENRKSGQSLEIDYRRALINVIESQRELAVADEELSIAEVELSKTEVLSPVTGIVDSLVTVGEVARQSMILVTLRVINPMYVDCQFDMADYSYLQAEKNNGTVTLRGLEGKKINASFVRESSESSSSDNLHWQFSVANEGFSIQSNMKGFIRFESDRRVRRVPSVALINRTDNKAQVFVVNDEDIAVLTPIEVGQQGGGFTEISYGLSEGDQVVVAGQLNLIDGDNVNMIDPRLVTYPYAD